MRKDLARRERQILDVLFQLGEATAKEVEDALDEDLANATIRTQLRILEQKGAVKHRIDGRRFIYSPAEPRKTAANSALRSVLDTFFSGSLEHALAAHLADPQSKLDKDDLQRLRDLIDQHQNPGE